MKDVLIKYGATPPPNLKAKQVAQKTKTAIPSQPK